MKVTIILAYSGKSAIIPFSAPKAVNFTSKKQIRRCPINCHSPFDI
ncbi:hypothetical protein ELI_1177 [Eubacterium callanderi]|uniref:Uncharacterized protein n=1 Tax=Eubacterium callanderi TaxID=53442 RepID=E3GK03_9FIRM|nr:hypothetical protein ELI_1177 [Eubacterium callanderi]